MNTLYADSRDDRSYHVVVNHEEQYSIWLADRPLPQGWQTAGVSGSREDCLAEIGRRWIDIRPASVSKQLTTDRAQQAELPLPMVEAPSLVSRLATPSPVLASRWRHERTIAGLEQAIARGYVYVTFLETQGQTELGVRLDPAATDIRDGDFKRGAGAVHLEGRVVLDGIKVRCIVDINLNSLQGTGYLVRDDS